MTKDSAFNRLREEEREVRRNLIIEAALSLLEKKSFDQIGMRDIASEAGISPASLYRYFPGQTELLMESFLYDLKEIIEEFHKRVRDGQIKNTEEFALQFVDLLMEKEATFQMMSYMMVKADISDELLDRFNNMMRVFFSSIQDVFEFSGINFEGRAMVHAFFACLTGIVMVFRNFPAKDKDVLVKHIKKLAVISSFSFTREDVCDFAKSL